VRVHEVVASLRERHLLVRDARASRGVRSDGRVRRVGARRSSTFPRSVVLEARVHRGADAVRERRRVVVEVFQTLQVR
jgi:hypothetical protein